jgi:hypothetical protein
LVWLYEEAAPLTRPACDRGADLDGAGTRVERVRCHFQNLADAQAGREHQVDEHWYVAPDSDGNGP